MSARRRRFGRDTSGAAAVELALISPMFLMLVIGVIQLGWVLHCAASVRWALEASSRSLLINPELSASDVRSAMLDKLSGVADAANLSVTISPDATAKTLLVQSRYAARLAVPFVPTDTLTFENAVTVPVLN